MVIARGGGGMQSEETKQEENMKIIIDEKDGAEMVLIPAGPFLFGSREDDKEVNDDEKPQRTIELPDYYMDKYPVTNERYCCFLNEVQPKKKQLDEWVNLSGKNRKNPCRIIKVGRRYAVRSGDENQPLTWISWYGAKAYADWAGKRLLTKYEWEKAARGTNGNKNLDGQSHFGCSDMFGDILEWTSSVCGANNFYVVRGGCHSGYHDFYYFPHGMVGFVGFRCART